MAFYDDDKQNLDHYYSPNDEHNDDEVLNEVPFSSHYYSPSDDDREDEEILPFSHVDLSDEEDGENFDNDYSEEEKNVENGVIDGYFEEDNDDGEASSLEETASENDFDGEDPFTEEDINEAFDYNETQSFDSANDEKKDQSEDENTVGEFVDDNDELDEFTEPVDPAEKKVKFVAEDDGYDYSNTDDADDMADDDNVFDKEPEYLFNDDYPEEPEKLGAMSSDVTENDYMDSQISFDDFAGYSEEGDLTEDFFSTPPRAEESPIEDEDGSPEEALESIETQPEPLNEPFEEKVDREIELEAEVENDRANEAEEEIPEIEKEQVFAPPYDKAAQEAQIKAAEEAFEREREAHLKIRNTEQYETFADRTPDKTFAEGKENSEQKKERKYMFMEDSSLNVAKIMVCGVGGAGNNAVNRMIDMNVSTAAFVAINTDKQALMLSKCDMENRFQIGAGETKGLGAGADPDVGERAAEESQELIADIVDGVDLLFIAAGMGGGTGTGAAPVIAKIAREKGCVTVAVVTKPFGFEGRKRAANAERGIANLKKYVDTIIIIPNDKLMEALRPDTPIVDALGYADDTLRQGICGIADLIATPSLINLDFADVRTVIKDQGLAHMGIGRAKGDNRIMEAVREAVSSPLLETTIEGARGIILNVTGGNDLTIRQVNDAARQVQDIIDPSANIIFGMNINPKLQEEVIITLIATGFNTDGGAIDEQEEEDEAQARAYQRLFSKNPEAVERVEEKESEPTVVEEPEPEPEVEDKNKGGGIPSFMRRLFKK